MVVVEVAPPSDRTGDPVSSLLSLSFCLSLAGGFSYAADTYRVLIEETGMLVERELRLPRTGKLVLVCREHEEARQGHQ